jgi:hypothetical protein
MRTCKRLWWIIVTLWLGHRLLCRLVRQALALRIFLSQTKRCSRGHLTPVFGVYQCRCKTILEGFVFRRCPICKQTASYTPCLECGLPLRNPFL